MDSYTTYVCIHIVKNFIIIILSVTTTFIVQQKNKQLKF